MALPAPGAEPASELRHRLIDAIAKIPVAGSLGDRRLLISLIRRDTVGFPDIEERPETRLHVVSIVVACLELPGSLWALRGALIAMAPDDPGTRQACSLIEAAGLSSFIPETDLRRGRELLSKLSDAEELAGWRDFLDPFAPHVVDRASTLTTAFDQLVSIGSGPTAMPPALALCGWAANTSHGQASTDLRAWRTEQVDRLGLDDESVGSRLEAPARPAEPETGDTEAAAEGHDTGQHPWPAVPGTRHAMIKMDNSSVPEVHVNDGPYTIESGEDMPAAAPSRPARRLPRVWGDVPPRNPNFTGRTKLLEKLHHQLQLVREAAVLPQALHGMGGVGKSQLAIEYVHQHSRDYDLVWWVPAEQNNQVLLSLTKLAQRLGLDVSPEANSAVPAVQDALNTGSLEYERWLLVFDNAESLQDVRPFFPTGGAGKILVTSRNPEWGAVARALEVDVFAREESKEFLSKRTPELADEDAERLAEALGDLPLAIEQAAAWHAATGMSVDQYLQLLDQKRIELLDDTSSPAYQRSVAAAWKISLERLDEVNRAALQVLQICAFFSPEPISRDFFAGVTGSPIVQPLDETLGDPIKLGRAIRDIQRYALAKFNHQDNTLQIHRLVQAVLVGRMDADQREVMRAGAQALLANANPGNPARRREWARYLTLLPHVRSSRAVESTDPKVLQLVYDVVAFLYHWGDHTGCLEFAQEAYTSWLSILGEDHPFTLRIANQLGYINSVLGHYKEAGDLFSLAAEAYRRTSGEDYEGTLDAMLMVAYSYRLQGEFAEAKALDEKTYASCLRQFGEDDPVTLTAAHNLGLSLRLTGAFADAAERDLETFGRRQEVFGNSDLETLRTLGSYVTDLREAGDFVRARERQEEVVERMLRASEAINPYVMRASRDLAVSRRKAGDHAGALTLSKEALERFRRRYGNDYPETMSAELAYAVDLRQNGDLDAAATVVEACVVRYREVFGEKHPHALSAQVNFAIIQRLRGDHQAAYRSDQQALEILQSRLGPDHPTTLACAANLASDLYALGDAQAAFELDTNTLARSERVLGVEHPSTLAVSVNLALDLRALGRAETAEALHSDTMVRFRRTLGDQHPATLNALKSIRADCDLDPATL